MDVLDKPVVDVMKESDNIEQEFLSVGQSSNQNSKEKPIVKSNGVGVPEPKLIVTDAGEELIDTDNANNNGVVGKVIDAKPKVRPSKAKYSV